MFWVLLIAAIVAEVTATSFPKLIDGFSKPETGEGAMSMEMVTMNGEDRLIR